MIQETAGQVAQEIMTRVDALAAQLGVTVEYLWPTLVQYQVARGLGVLLGALVFSFTSGLLLLAALRAEHHADQQA